MESSYILALISRLMNSNTAISEVGKLSIHEKVTNHIDLKDERLHYDRKEFVISVSRELALEQLRYFN